MGGTCATLFDLSDRLAAAGVGPVLIAESELVANAQSPVPVDGLIESESMFAFVANEAIGELQDDCDGDGNGVLDWTRLNDDSDGTDPVLRLRDRETGQILPIRTDRVMPSRAQGRAVTRVGDGAFRFEAEHALLRVEATDAAGNVAACTVDLSAGGDGTGTLTPAAPRPARGRAAGARPSNR